MVHKGHPFVAGRCRSSLGSRQPSCFLVLGAEQSLASQGSEQGGGAGALGPGGALRLRALGVLVGRGSPSSTLLHHGCRGGCREQWRCGAKEEKGQQAQGRRSWSGRGITVGWPRYLWTGTANPCRYCGSRRIRSVHVASGGQPACLHAAHYARKTRRHLPLLPRFPRNERSFLVKGYSSR